MCDGGIDELTEVQLDRWIKAAKVRPCMACKEKIMVGIVYHQSKRLGDGHWETWSHCVRCWRICEALWARNGGECIDMDLNCGEVWSRPPSDVEALAFALPADLQEEPSDERDAELRRMRSARAHHRRRQDARKAEDAAGMIVTE